MFNWWTFAFEIINLIVVVYILYRLLFRPVMDVIIERRDEIDRSRAEIDQGREEIQNLKNEIEVRIKELDADKRTTLEEARTEALKEKQMILDDTKKEIEREREKLRKILDDERRKLDEEIREKTVDLSRDISGRMISSIMDRELNETLVNKVLMTIKDLAEKEKDEIMGDSKKTCNLQVSSAYPLSEETAGRIIKTVEKVFSCQANCNFSEAPGLVGGVLIRINNRVFDGTISGNLMRFASTLKEQA